MSAIVRETTKGTARRTYEGYCSECLWFTPKRMIWASKAGIQKYVTEHNLIWHGSR